MHNLNLPAYEYQLKEINGKLAIFDSIRKKYVVLTPEEWVRQHIIHYLNDELKYPAARTNVEGGLRYNSRSKRTDVMIYDNAMQPLVLVECKAPSVKIDEKVVRQLATYNSQCNAKLLITTNGLVTFAVLCKEGEHSMLQRIPDYAGLNEMLT